MRFDDGLVQLHDGVRNDHQRRGLPDPHHRRRLLQRCPSNRGILRRGGAPNVTHPSAEFLDFQAALAGEYSIERELGRGGMGVVYLARDVSLDRDVAIKVLPAHLARTAEARERFVREARTAAGLSHPHIVPIHRVGEAGGFVFFVMSYVEGESLGERLRTRGPLPPADATRVLGEVRRPAWRRPAGPVRRPHPMTAHRSAVRLASAELP